MAQKTWFITGCSRGFGREWAEAAHARGDRVAATACEPPLAIAKERYSQRLKTWEERNELSVAAQGD
jgi:NAD(P)-dependent dehydrogenase (short-subunit alcohol dehydrogenase family)